MNECQIKERGECCCNCRFLAKVNLDCAQQREKGYATKEDGCLCHIQIGWVCIADGMTRVENGNDFCSHSVAYWRGDSEHGGCDSYAPIGE